MGYYTISDLLRKLNIEQYSKKIYLKPHEYYWMRHGESCANVVKKTCKEDKTKCKEILEKYREKKEKIVDINPHHQVKNPNISIIGIKQCRSVNANITKNLFGDNKVQKNKVKTLNNTIVFCSTLVRAIETAVLTSGKTNISYAYFSLNKDKFIEHVKNYYDNTVFVIPYIKEKDVLKIQTSDNTATDFCDSMYRLTSFFEKLNIKINFSKIGKSSQEGGEIIIKDKTQALVDCKKNFNPNEYFTEYEKLKNISDYTLFRDEIESEIIKPLLDTFLSEKEPKLNTQLPLYIVSHQGFILEKVLNMSKDEKNNIYIKNCNVVSNLHSNESIEPKFKPDDINSTNDALKDKFCLITPSTDTISLDKKISRIKYILELSIDEYNIIQGYKNKIIELETQIKELDTQSVEKKEEKKVLNTIHELLKTEMDFYYDMVILISCTRYIFDLKGEKINGKIDKPIEISDRKKDFFNKYISYIIKFTKSLINLDFKYTNNTNLLTFNIKELENIHKDKNTLYIVLNISKILTQTKINDLLNEYKIIASNNFNNIDFLNITSNKITTTSFTYQALYVKPLQRIMKYPLFFKNNINNLLEKNNNNNNIKQLIDIIQKIHDIQENYFTDTNDNKTIQDVKNIIGDKIFAYYLDDKIGKNIHIEVLFERLNEKLEKFNFLFDFLKKNSQIKNKIGDKIDNQEYGNLKNILDKEYKPKLINRLGGRNPLSYLRSVLKGYSGVENALLDEIKTLPQSAGNNKKRTRKQPSNSKYKTKKNPSIHKGNQSKKRGITKGNHKSKKRS